MNNGSRAPAKWSKAWTVGLGLLVVVALAAWTPAWAGAPTDQLKGAVDRIVQILEDPSMKAEAKAAERRAAIRKEAEQVFDFQETAKRALGPHWQNLSEAERNEFVSLFADLLERSYISKIEQYSGEKVTYAGDSVASGAATVKTRFTTSKGTDVPIDYRMLSKGDRWLVYDVNIEGISLIGNYRTQFNKIIQTSSFQDLVAKMKSRQSDFGAPSAPGGKPKS